MAIRKDIIPGIVLCEIPKSYPLAVESFMK